MTGSRDLQSDEGSALVLALVFTAVWSVVILAVLAFAEFGFGVRQGTDRHRADLYAVDGALDAAIAYLETDLAAGCASLAGFAFDLAGTPVTLTCSGERDAMDLAATIPGRTDLVVRARVSFAVTGGAATVQHWSYSDG